MGRVPSGRASVGGRPARATLFRPGGKPVAGGFDRYLSRPFAAHDLRRALEELALPRPGSPG